MSDHVRKSRRLHRFTKRDLTRAIKAVRDAGLNVANVRVDPDGSIEVIPVIPGTTPRRTSANNGGSVDNLHDIADVL